VSAASRTEESGRVRDWKTDLLRTTAGAFGTVVALAIAGWPSSAATAAWTGLLGAVFGLGIAFALEYLYRLRHDALLYHEAVRTLASEREQWERERRVHEYRVAVAQREAAVSAVGVEVFGGAFNEAVSTGHVLPLSAIMARYEALMESKNLNTPIPPLDLDG
jgi:hypothetical protein